MPGYAISEKQCRELESAAADLAVLIEANAVILCDSAGRVLAGGDATDAADRQTFCALAAGSFAASRELAYRLNEESFLSIYQQGDRCSIYVHSVADAFLFIVIFDKQTTVGLVKLYVGRKAEEMLPLFREIAGQSIRSAATHLDGFVLDVERDPFLSVRVD
jgi:predicted regulator of Ras-like GTPase activity (Roadblock/LC7/MglB family)